MQTPDCGDSATNCKNHTCRAVRTLGKMDQTGFIRPDNRGACSVSEKNTGAPVIPVHKLAQGLCPYDQRVLVNTAVNIGIGGIHGKHETGTGRIDIKSNRFLCTKNCLYLTGRRSSPRSPAMTPSLPTFVVTVA